MARLIRLDGTGHTTLAEWAADDPDSAEAAVAALRTELDRGMLAAAEREGGKAEPGGARGPPGRSRRRPARGRRGPVAATVRSAPVAPGRAPVDRLDGVRVDAV